MKSSLTLVPILNKILFTWRIPYSKKETPSYYIHITRPSIKKRYLPRSKSSSSFFFSFFHERLSMNPWQRHGISVFIGNAIWPPQTTVSCRLWRGYACETQGGVKGRGWQKGYSPGLIRHRARRVTKVFTFPRFKGTRW